MDDDNFKKDIFSMEKGIIELTLKDFENNNNKLYIKNKYFKNKKGFIIFYAPWCKHCNKLSNVFIELALLNIHLFPFGSVNSENIEMGNDLVCSYENIQSFPTIKYIDTNGSLIDYKYEYTFDNLLYFINIHI
jgi:thiol-disulfide isomerase/thioredoxin